MFDLDKWLEVFATLRRNKLRTVLTACGVFWGIFMLVVMLGFGDGLERGVMENMVGFANNNVYIWGQRTQKAYKGMSPGRRIKFTTEDLDSFEHDVDGILAVAPRNQLGGWRDGNNVSHGAKTGNFGVMGDYPEYNVVDPVGLSRGRFINHRDMAARRKVTVIGAQVRRVLFDDGVDPIGKYVKIRGVHFQVVGLHQSTQPGEEGERANSTLYVPFSTFQTAFNNANRVGWFAVAGQPDTPAELVEKRAREALKSRHQVHPDDDNAIGSYNAGEKFERMQNLFTGIRFFIWFVSVLTLLAGALGVSNIMLISVKERTKEIGVRKALGATPRSVIALVIQESLVLTALAGYGGLVAGVVVLEGVSAWVAEGGGTLAPPSIDVSVALISAVVLCVVGVLAGLAPARHAAQIRPVVALRAE